AKPEPGPHERHLEDAMQIGDIMTSKVQLAKPNQSIREIARIMAEFDCGAMPVGDNDRLIGIITDRDIAVRAVALGKSPDRRGREVWGRGVLYCSSEENIAEAESNMADRRWRRMPWLNEGNGLVGIASPGAIAMRDGPSPPASPCAASASRAATTRRGP